MKYYYIICLRLSCFCCQDNPNPTPGFSYRLEHEEDSWLPARLTRGYWSQVNENGKNTKERKRWMIKEAKTIGVNENGRDSKERVWGWRNRCACKRSWEGLRKERIELMGWMLRLNFFCFRKRQNALCNWKDVLE